ncbi:MAG: undecaprenyl-phosphate glucose phosphotransferase [Fibrobacterota bacterium]
MTVIPVVLITDLLIVSIAWMLAYHIRFRSGIIPFFAYPEELYSVYLRTLPFVLVVWFLVFRFFGIYSLENSRIYLYKFSGFLKPFIFFLGVLFSLSFYIRGFSYSRIHFSLYALITFCLILLSRIIGKFIIVHILSNKIWFSRTVLLVGVAGETEKYMRRVRENGWVGIKLSNWLLDDEDIKKITPGIRKLAKEAGCEIITADYSKIKEIIKKNKINEVVVALSGSRSSEIDRIVKVLADCFTDIKIIPDISGVPLLNFNVEKFHDIPILNIVDIRYTLWSRIVKRIMDFCVASAAIFLGLPLWVFIGLMIKFTSKGKIFYIQERMGLDGRLFKMYKFRTMRSGAEEETGPVWAGENDERITGIGKFLRKTSLDEAPQFFNVLKGEMSVVGPRPERENFIMDFKNRVRGYHLRHRVKSGITGWAQINGLRGQGSSIEKRIEYDIYYIENWSVLFDTIIMIRTLFGGFYGKGY